MFSGGHKQLNPNTTLLIQCLLFLNAKGPGPVSFLKIIELLHYIVSMEGPALINCEKTLIVLNRLDQSFRLIFAPTLSSQFILAAIQLVKHQEI